MFEAAPPGPRRPGPARVTGPGPGPGPGPQPAAVKAGTPSTT